LKILIRNPRRVATLDADGRSFGEGAILIEDGKIAALFEEPPPLSVDHEIDASDMLVTPGLVNTHHHLYQTLTRNLPEAQNAPLFGWLQFHYEIWRGLDEEMLAVATRTGLAELLLSGCTCTSDHHYVFPAGAAPDLIDRQIEIATDLGIRFQPTRGSMSLGRSAGGLPPDDLVQDEAVILADSKRLVALYHDPAPGAMFRIDLAPCSPFSVTEQAMRDTAALAREAGLRLHTHVAETLDEERFCLEVHDLRPVAYMESLGWMGRDVWFAHGIHLNDQEVARMGDTGTGVAHCPSSNMRLGSGIARVKELLAAGAPVGLAVDGSASNDMNHLIAEARQMLLLSRLRDEEQWLGAEEVWRCATSGGARVLGRSELGSIEVGMAADLALWDLGRLDMAGAQSDPLAALLFSAAAPRPRWVIVNGEIRVREGKIPGFDERAQAGLHNEAAAELLRRAGR